MTIAAIQTRYKGYHFRSRLEARWAVFFDAMGIEWQYEPEGFDCNGVAYLPDFCLRMHLGMCCGKAALAGRMAALSQEDEIRDALARSDQFDWSDEITVLGPETIFQGWVEVKPAAPLMEKESKKLLAFVEARQQPFLVVFGDPFEMNACSPSYHDRFRFGFGRAAICGAKDGYAVVLGQGAGCETNDFCKIVAGFRPQIIDAATSARSARFEHGEARFEHGEAGFDKER